MGLIKDYLISQITEQIKTLYLFSGIRQSVRYRSAVDGDVSGTYLGVAVVSDGHLMSFSGADTTLAFVSAANIRLNFIDPRQEIYNLDSKKVWMLQHK